MSTEEKSENKRPQFGNRFLSTNEDDADKEVFQHNAW